MKVIVDRLNGIFSIELRSGPAARTVSLGADVTAGLDRFGRLTRLRLANPLAPGIRKTVLPRLAAQFHEPQLARLDPRLLMEQTSKN